MKASLFCTARHMSAAPHDIWPLSGEYYSGDAAVCYHCVKEPIAAPAIQVFIGETEALPVVVIVRRR
jgi:hypothetical protein